MRNLRQLLFPHRNGDVPDTSPVAGNTIGDGGTLTDGSDNGEKQEVIVASTLANPGGPLSLSTSEVNSTAGDGDAGKRDGSVRRRFLRIGVVGRRKGTKATTNTNWDGRTEATTTTTTTSSRKLEKRRRANTIGDCQGLGGGGTAGSNNNNTGGIGNGSGSSPTTGGSGGSCSGSPTQTEQRRMQDMRRRLHSIAASQPPSTSKSGGIVIDSKLTCRRARSGEVVIVRQYRILRNQSSSPPSLDSYCSNNNSSSPSYQSSNHQHQQQDSYYSWSPSALTSAATAAAMGAFLDKPKTEKTNSNGDGNGIHYGISQMQGWRVDMEDAHTSIIGLAEDGPMKEWSFFAVFDGHAGSRVAHYGSTHLLESILATKQMKEALSLIGAVVSSTNSNSSPSSSSNNAAGEAASSSSQKQMHADLLLSDTKIRELIKAGMRDGFLDLDEAMLNLPEVYGDQERSGSTAVVALVTPSVIFVANLGDSRAIISRRGAGDSDTERSPTFATDDHKPYLPKERDRIVNAGGSVMIQRVNGSLAVSRALGDYEYKQVSGLPPIEQLVSPEPDVYEYNRDDSQDEFLLLACDGIYDVMTNQELAQFVRSRLEITHDLPSITNQILDACLSKGSRDNMSVVLVSLPGVPELNDSAIKLEHELHQQLENRIQGIVSLSDNLSEVEADYVLRILINQEIPGIPPGAGVHALRNQLEDILKKLKDKTNLSSATNPIGGGTTTTGSSTTSTPPGSNNNSSNINVNNNNNNAMNNSSTASAAAAPHNKFNNSSASPQKGDVNSTATSATSATTE